MDPASEMLVRAIIQAAGLTPQARARQRFTNAYKTGAPRVWAPSQRPVGDHYDWDQLKGARDP